MSKFLYHESCPRCGSKDNLGVWEDGHKWCFGCKYYEHGKVDVRLIHGSKQKMTTNTYGFPDDAAHYIPKEPLEWLLSCGITHTMQRQHNIVWSEKQQMVCWKVGETCWQGRCFNKEAKAKYVSYGKIHEQLFILENTEHAADTPVVLVEDFMSAVRVSAYSPCMPLFGCVISTELLQALSKRFKRVLIWLDADKVDNARKIGLKANLIGLESKVIYTHKDPKNYSNSEIELFVKGQENVA